MSVNEKVAWKTLWKIRRFESEAAFKAGLSSPVIDGSTGKLLPAESIIHNNVLLNEGIAVILTLIAGTGGTAWSNAAAYIGVGDSATAAAASQTALQAVTNKLWKAQETSYPSITGQAITFQSVFGASDANYAWNEFTVVNASTDTGDNLNRKVSAEGTKTSGQVWTVDVEITFS